MLNILGLNSFYGKVHVLKDINLQVEESEIVAVVGPNGAGKSTLLRTIIGLIHPNKGRIYFKKRDITKVPAEKMGKYEISLVPEGRSIFTNLSIYDNLRLGVYSQKEISKDEIKRRLEFIFSLFPILKERVSQQGGTLSGGQQQMLAIGRSLMSNPKLLLLDEPSLGLAPLVVKEILETIKEINRKGTTMILVEQNTKKAFEISNKGYVLVLGKIIISDTGKNLLEKEDIINLYLGRGK